jgi:hypothetical protein
MHISERYGPVEKGVQSMALANLESPADSSWTHGARQKELNQQGAYIHRFYDQQSLQAVIAAVKKISENNVCTPCTLIGPSLCKTYNHHFWEGCAAMLFSPSMPTMLGYKGDILSNRLAYKTNLKHSNFCDSQRSRSESLELFAEEIRTTFNGYSATPSAFAGRREKQLNLVVNTNHQAAKIKEMAMRGNLYFAPKDRVAKYNLDVPSKNLILELSSKHKDFKLSNKPEFKTKKDVLDFIDKVTSFDPSLLPFLQAARIKISSFKNDSAIATYFNSANKTCTKQAHERSYSEFLKWQFDYSQTENYVDTYGDKNTALTPNEVLGMPSPEDLIGLIIDLSTSKSMDQALATLGYLKNQSAPEWNAAGETLAPFTHLISHMEDSSIIQLGWSKMVIPYSTEGLKSYCTTGNVTSIDNHRFTPDYFTLLHRIASHGILVFSKNYRNVDILNAKPNVIRNFSEILCGNGKGLLYNAIAQPKIPFATLRLFCHLDRLSSGNFDNLKAVLNNFDVDTKRTESLLKLVKMNEKQVENDLNRLLSSEINRIERSVFNHRATPRTIKFRAGFQDQGVFEYNKELGSLSLINGIRVKEDGTRLVGRFKPVSNMSEGGAEFSFGIHKKNDSTTFGSFDKDVAPFQLYTNTNAESKKKRCRLFVGGTYDFTYIDFYQNSHLRLVFVHDEMRLKGTIPNFLARFENPHITPGHKVLTIQPLKVLKMLADTIESIDYDPNFKLEGAIANLAHLRCRVVKHLEIAEGLIENQRHPLNVHNVETQKLLDCFERIKNVIDTKMKGLAERYNEEQPYGQTLFSPLDAFSIDMYCEIRWYLWNEFQIHVLEKEEPPRSYNRYLDGPLVPEISERTPPPVRTPQSRTIRNAIGRNIMQRIGNLLNIRP